MARPASAPELVGGSFWRNTAAAPMPETSPASVGRHPTVPLLGRERERARVRAAAALVETSASSRIVTLLGEGGIGKTRLLRELERELVGNGYRVWSAAAPSLPLSYGLLGRLLLARFQLAETGPGTSAADAVRRIVAEVVEPGQVADVCYLLGPLIEQSFEQTALTRAVAEDAQQAHLLRRTLLRRFFEADAAATPICLSLDNLHSADADSIELLGYLSENLAAPVLLLCSARPELLKRCPEWLELGHGRHERIDVGPLPEADALAVMRALLAPCVGGPPEPLVEAAVGTARGNPGLLAQMLQIFHDSGVLTAASDARWTVHLDKLASARLPLTADDAVTARIAALSPNERKLLEHAAVMGSVFWLGGLVALGRVDRDPPELWTEEASSDVEALKRTLEDLMRRDYVLELPDSSFPDEVEFVFKHNLEREKIAALTSSASSRRYHQILADWLSQKESVRSQEEYSAMLAGHLTRAGSRSRAGLTYLDAGDLARQNFASKKAHEYYTSGLELLGDGDAGRRIEALHNHGDVLLLLGRTDEALSAFREMLALSYRLGLKAKGGAAHNRIGRLYRDIGNLEAAERQLSTALGLFREGGDDRGVAASHDDLGKLLWVKGEYDRALDQLLMALEMRKRFGDRRSIALSLNNMGLVWMDHGRPKKAQEALEAALAIRKEVGDVLGLVETLNNLGRLAQDQGDHQGALELFEEAHRLAAGVGEHNRIAVVLTSIGEAHYRLGNAGESIRILKQAEQLCDELGDKIHLAEAKRGLAKAYMMNGEPKLARETIKQAVDLFAEVRSKFHLAVALRTLGEITGAGAWGEGHQVKAVDYFMRAISISKEIGNEQEVARSYRAFADYVARSPHFQGNAKIQREAIRLSEMADEIFRRHRIEVSGS